MLHTGLSQLLNHIRGSYAVRWRPKRVSGTPRFLQVEVSSRCNLECSHCLRPRLRSPRRSGEMAMDTFERVCEEFPRLDVLTLHGLGEPLLNSDLPEMVRSYRATNPFTRIGMSTNGLLLEGELLREVVSCGFYEIGISLDAATAQTYESVRGSREFEHVVSNIGELVAARAGRLPRVALAFVVLPANWAEMTRAVELGMRLGVDQVSICDLNLTWAPESKWEPARAEQVREEWESARRTAGSRGIELTYAKFDKTLWGAQMRCRPCFYLWDMPYITWEGYVTPCCALPDPDLVRFGNLRETTFRSIWNSAEYRDYRAAVTSEEPPEPCTGCHHLC
jgi:radical SAM protein with 4Fe4S-binding SPASM domain